MNRIYNLIIVIIILILITDSVYIIMKRADKDFDEHPKPNSRNHLIENIELTTAIFKIICAIALIFLLFNTK